MAGRGCAAGWAVLVGVLLLVRSDIDFDTFLNYFALGLLIFVLISSSTDSSPFMTCPMRSRSTATIPTKTPSMRRAGEPLHASRHMAVSLDLGDALSTRPRLGLKDSAPEGANISSHDDERLKDSAPKGADNSSTTMSLKSFGIAWLNWRSATRREFTDELLLILIYTGLCVAIFKILRIPVNKWSLSTATLGGIFLIGIIMLVMNYNHPFSVNARVYFATTPVIPDVKGRVIEVPVKSNEILKKGDVLFRIDPSAYEFEVAQRRAASQRPNRTSRS